MLLALAAAAFADTLVLDNGATLSGSLAAYERGGSCTISVTDGELSGADVVLPCTRIARFDHDPDNNPVSPPTAQVEEVEEVEEIDPPSSAIPAAVRSGYVPL